MKEFQESILPVLVNDSRVRTIEFCGKYNFDNEYPEGNYIIHIVGNLSDIRKIILLLHHSVYERDFRCRTFVIPTTEELSQQKYGSLEETILRNPALREIVYRIIYYLKFIDPVNPFIIKHLPRDIIEKIANFNIHYQASLKPLDGAKRSNLLKILNKFVYGLCYGILLNQNLNEEIIRNIKDYCSETYNNLAEKIEQFLDKKRKDILDILDKMIEETKTLNINKLKEVDIEGKDAYTILTNTSITSLGSLQRAIIVWCKLNGSDKIGYIDFISILKQLDTPIMYRNIFAHPLTKEKEEKLKTKGSKDFVNGLLNSAITLFDFGLAYCKDEERK